MVDDELLADGHWVFGKHVLNSVRVSALVVYFLRFLVPHSSLLARVAIPLLAKREFKHANAFEEVFVHLRLFLEIFFETSALRVQLLVFFKKVVFTRCQLALLLLQKAHHTLPGELRLIVLAFRNLESADVHS